MGVIPTLKSLRREDFADAPAYFLRFLDVFSSFAGDVTAALGGGLDASNLGKQFADIKLTTASTLSETFAPGRVVIKNRLKFRPRSVTIGKCQPSVQPTYTPGDWVTVGASGAPAFETGWSSYAAVDGSFAAPAFRRDGAGRVQLRGLATGGTVSSVGIVFTLPVGFRPAKHTPYSTNANEAFGSGRVYQNGQVLAVAGSNVWWGLDGVSFEASPGTWAGVGPFGAPQWSLTSNGTVQINYIAGLSPNTQYDLTLVLE